MTTLKTKWYLDLALLVGFLVGMDPHTTGVALHEWLTLMAFITILIHLLLSWDWITQVTRRFLTLPGMRTRINYIVNWLMFINGILLMMSGLLISRSVLPTLGLEVRSGFIWRGLHDMSANLALLLLGVHTALHWDWVVNAFRKFVVQPVTYGLTRRSSQKGGV